MCVSTGRSWLLAVTLFVPSIAVAQVDLRPTPTPTVTADNASWYQLKEAIIFAGNTYYPAGAQVFFNGNEMVRSGSYRGVPLYTRTTEEPYSKVYAPLPGNLLQPYERRREGELAGTVGTSTPSFPVDRSTDPVSDVIAGGSPQAAGPPTGLSPLSSVVDAAPVNAGTAPTPPAATPPQPTRAKASPKRASVTIVYIEYDGRKWYSSGPTVEYRSSRFTSIGTYHGLPVYADRNDKSGTIYVPVEKATPSLLAPYSRRK
jgi:hypothetical protein